MKQHMYLLNEVAGLSCLV